MACTTTSCRCQCSVGSKGRSSARINTCWSSGPAHGASVCCPFVCLAIQRCSSRAPDQGCASVRMRSQDPITKQVCDSSRLQGWTSPGFLLGCLPGSCRSSRSRARIEWTVWRWHDRSSRGAGHPVADSRRARISGLVTQSSFASILHQGENSGGGRLTSIVTGWSCGSRKGASEQASTPGRRPCAFQALPVAAGSSARQLRGVHCRPTTLRHSAQSSRR